MTMVSRTGPLRRPSFLESRDRMDPTLPSSCSPKAMRCMASSAAHPLSIRIVWITSTRIRTNERHAFHLHYGDLANAAHLSRLINQIQPDEVYNLGAQSHVRVSFDQAEYTADVVATGTLRLLEAFRDYARETGREPRFYQAGSSEMFGASPPPQNETTPFYPRSPYAVSKVAAHWYSQSTNGRHTISSSVTEFSSITSLRAVAKHSLRARSRALWAESSSVCRKNSISEILMHGAIGATRLITSARCG